MPRKNHPYADLFPTMTAAELDALAADVAENGLRHPVVLYGGKVLDGRNRLAACEKAKVEPTFTEHEGDDASALALVISLNVQRRDMTAGQRAIVAARALPMFEALHPEGRPKRGTDSATKGRSRDDASKVFKVGANAVQQAKALLANAPDLAQQVEACTVSLAAAYEEQQSRRQQSAQRDKAAERVAEFREAISNGEITIDEALHRIQEKADEDKKKLEVEADARRTWLRSFAEHLAWFERFLYEEKFDEYLAWYTIPDAPGFFDNGVTSERVQSVAARLEATAKFNFRGKKK